VLQHPSVCEQQELTFGYCDRAGGLDCRYEPSFDPSCAIVATRPPHFYFCRIDASPPPGCEPYSRTGDHPFGYCCP
jgi:hypothetical protein